MMHRILFSVLGLILLVGSATSSMVQVKRVQMHTCRVNASGTRTFRLVLLDFLKLGEKAVHCWSDPSHHLRWVVRLPSQK